MSPTLISVVVPTHNEKANIEPLYQRLRTVFDSLPGHDFELIYADDSRDDTPEEIIRVHEIDPRVKLIRLSRRFSQPIAITAGLDRADGDAVILMDADLQDPPETIPQLLELWRQGNEVVYVERESASNYLVYKYCSQFFYRVLTKIAAIDIPPDSGEFRLLDRRVVEFLRKLTEQTRYYRGLTVWPGMRRAKIRIERAQRASGETHYNFRRSLMIAIDGWVSFSLVPLRAATVAGAAIALLSLLGGAGYAAVKLIRPALPGFALAAILAAILFACGVQLIFLGILGEYIGRIFVETQKRPLYWVDYEIGFEHRSSTNPRTDVSSEAGCKTAAAHSTREVGSPG